MWSAFSSWILRLLGWKFEGAFPLQLSKYVIIVIPHTSNWDFPMGLLVRSATKVNALFAAKHTLFRFPLGGLFRWLGGYPVDRSKRSNFVDAVVDIYNARDDFILTIAPEGTRKKVKKLKSGFYYIALGAKVPIVMVKFDFGQKIIGIREPFFPSGDKEADYAIVNQYFKGVRGKVAENSWNYEAH